MTGQEQAGFTSIGEPPGHFATVQVPTPAAVAPQLPTDGWQPPPLAADIAPVAPLEDDLVVVSADKTYDITKKLSTGFEVSCWKTSYLDRRPIPRGPFEQGNSVTLDWMFRYGF